MTESFTSKITEACEHGHCGSCYKGHDQDGGWCECPCHPEPTGSLVLPEWTVRFEFKLRDLWVGAYWDSMETMLSSTFDLWICVVPCLPLHINRRVRKRGTNAL